jgi:hypothetical protein
MIRISRAALTLLAAGLLLALSANAAQATPLFEATSYPAAIKSASQEIVIGTEAGTINCPTTYEGTLKAASSTVTVTRFTEYWACSFLGLGEMTVSNNGCTEQFAATEREAADQYKGTWSMSCPTASGLTYATATCTVEFPTQSGVKAVDLDDVTGSPNKVTLDFEVTGLTYVVTKDGFLCPFKGTGTKTDGTITGEPLTFSGLVITGE